MASDIHSPRMYVVREPVNHPFPSCLTLSLFPRHGLVVCGRIAPAWAEDESSEEEEESGEESQEGSKLSEDEEDEGEDEDEDEEEASNGNRSLAKGRGAGTGRRVRSAVSPS